MVAVDAGILSPMVAYGSLLSPMVAYGSLLRLGPMVAYGCPDHSICVPCKETQPGPIPQSLTISESEASSQASEKVRKVRQVRQVRFFYIYAVFYNDIY